MAGGTIYEKAISADGPQGSTDNCLIIEPKHAWQIPLSYGNDWNEIKIGLFYSYVNADDYNGNYPTPSSIATHLNSGGTTPDTYTYIGLTKNQFTKALPGDPANEAFVGLEWNRTLGHPNNSSNSYNAMSWRDDPIVANPDLELNVRAYSGSELKAWSFFDNADRHPRLCFNDPNDTGSIIDNIGDPSTSIYFYSYFSLTYKKVPSEQKLKVRIRNAKDVSAVSTSADPSLNHLKELLDGGDLVDSLFPTTEKSLLFSSFTEQQFIEYTDKLDSYIFYNAFSFLRPRIHAWAVKKIS